LRLIYHVSLITHTDAAADYHHVVTNAITVSVC